MPAAHFMDSTTSIPLSSLPHLLGYHAKRTPDAPVILAPGRAPLSYGRLYRHIGEVGHALRAKGISRNDRVIVVLPNGPQLAVAILAVAASAVCVPMNPAYGAEELDRYYSDLRPDALIIEAGSDSPVRRVALSRGVRVVELSAAFEAEAGLFTLTGDQADKPSSESVGPGDVALLAHTSGTTSRPKIIPQTHAQLCRSAYSWSAALTLRETDRCLSVMPLFHGHGLTATVLTSLAAGASVVCTPGPDVDRFFAWLTAFRPTWYSAVPTVHQAILAEARHHRERATECRLRFIRSVSAPLPLPVFAELEKTAMPWRRRLMGQSRAIRCRRANAKRVRSAYQWGWTSQSWMKMGPCCQAVRLGRLSSVARLSWMATTGTRSQPRTRLQTVG